MKQASTFKFRPFSRKQRQILNWWMDESPVNDYDGIIADGSIRSGKTVSMSLSFVLWAQTSFTGENFIMSGKTIGSFRRNVLGPLKRMLVGRGYSYEDKRSENLFEISKDGITNYYYIFGGKDEASQDLVQGITAAGAFFDEVGLMPESFVNQATARCSVDGSKFWFNCNPEGPDHWFKKNWIDRADEKNVLYLHFTMKDNLSLSEHIRLRYEHQYSGVFYKRYIEGLWVLAEGLLFPYLAEEPEKYTYSEGEWAFSKLVMGIDFGGNGSKTTFVLTGYMNGYKEFKVLEEYGLPLTSTIGSEEICDAFIAFYKLAIEKYGRVDWIFPDSASTTMINSLRAAAIKNGLNARNIKGCRKNEIKDRPRFIDMLLTSGRLKFSAECTDVLKALSSLVWDEKKKDIPEDKNINNCNDWYDAFCYTFLDFIEFIDLRR